MSNQVSKLMLKKTNRIFEPKLELHSYTPMLKFKQGVVRTNRKNNTDLMVLAARDRSTPAI